MTATPDTAGAAPSSLAADLRAEATRLIAAAEKAEKEVVAVPGELLSTVSGVKGPASWTDAPAVTSYLTTIGSVVFSELTAHGVTVSSSISNGIKPWIVISGLAIAAGAQIVNIVTHRGIQKAAVSKS